MPTQPIRLAVINGSTRRGRTSRIIIDWLLDAIRVREDLSPDLINLADVPLTSRSPVVGPDPETARVLADTSARLAAADAFIVITPEYNRSFPASLKNFVDWHVTEWQAKPVGFACYSGGVSRGLLAVEQLRPVFAELRAVTLRDTASFAGGEPVSDASGRPKDQALLAAVAKTLLDELVWWALALREARTARPYAG
ncbi:NADPH-dependent FMN reductase [Streptomyces mirabilis]|uniref:NADPH-dependent FMN reductase n=1 Tax=Streptomyces mirabilis TaxID=68239 RepID=UPI00224E5442|nr:NAD(P)H-dependent oxidoreductase [Streptomyces mirabilis]MCX4428528.1 NAD(P)H-dependent oxidoreductase [Streptomyces mirabilis]